MQGISLIMIYPNKGAQCNPWLSNTVQEGARRWQLKNCARRVLFKADFAVLSAQNEVVEPTIWVQNTLHSAQRCLFIIEVGSNANGPLHAYTRAPNYPKKRNCWLS